MSILTGFAIFFIFWWLLLFITLPHRMRSQLDDQHDSGTIIPTGTDPGAPSRPQLGKRLFWNTILSIIVFFLFWLLTVYFGFGVDDFAIMYR